MGLELLTSKATFLGLLIGTGSQPKYSAVCNSAVCPYSSDLQPAASPAVKLSTGIAFGQLWEITLIFSVSFLMIFFMIIVIVWLSWPFHQTGCAWRTRCWGRLIKMLLAQQSNEHLFSSSRRCNYVLVLAKWMDVLDVIQMEWQNLDILFVCLFRHLQILHLNSALNSECQWGSPSTHLCCLSSPWNLSTKYLLPDSPHRAFQWHH